MEVAQRIVSVMSQAVEVNWTRRTVESSALSLKCVHDIEGSDSLALGVLSVCDRVANDILQEDLEDASGLLVDETCQSQESVLGCPSSLMLFHKVNPPEIRFTPPRRARRRIAGFVIPWMLSRKIFR